MAGSYSSVFESPVGTVEIRADETGVVSVCFLHEPPAQEKRRSNAITELCERQLREYFDGKRRDFTVPLHTEGSGFQQKVWEQLRLIPYGKTISYLEIAKRLGDPGLTRAVGTANNRNPVAVIVPCHRVIGADGSLIGYAGGVDRKRKLLLLEGALAQQELF